MSNIAHLRMQRECKEVITSEDLRNMGILIEILDENFTKIGGQISGPPGTSYEGGTFKLDIDIPKEYPFKPPEVKFSTKIWHPNVSSKTGVICLDILKEQWAASMTLRTVLLSVQSLLCSPEPKNPQDAVVAKQFLKDVDLFNSTAKFWAQYYANAPGEKNPEMLAKITKLNDMGFSQNASLTSLSTNDWDLSKAIEDIAD
uniref:E2 ubiquitin-conjugating enzyme n=1 Tax=Acrobeloides nanus TaxID=290746 RepID=A0A914BWX4_9BILA